MKWQSTKNKLTECRVLMRPLYVVVQLVLPAVFSHWYPFYLNIYGKEYLSSRRTVVFPLRLVYLPSPSTSSNCHLPFVLPLSHLDLRPIQEQSLPSMVLVASFR